MQLIIYSCICFIVFNAVAEARVCKTKHCQSVAQTIRSYMNDSVDPCDSFYEYVCGNFPEVPTVDEKYLKNDLGTMLNNKVTFELKTSIENEILESDPKSFKKLKSFYDTCMNEERIDNYSEVEYLELLKNLGGWPVLYGSSWDSSNFNWINTTHALRKIGFLSDSIINLNFGIDRNDTKKLRLKIGQPSFKHFSQYLSSDDSNLEDKNDYLTYMSKLAKIFGASNETIYEDSKKVLDLEVQLAKISLAKNETGITKNVSVAVSIGQLQKNYPYINWLQYLNDYISPYGRVKLDDVVIIAEPKYFENLKDVLVKAETRVLANYIFWHFIMESDSFLSKRVREAKNGTINIESPRWKECVKSARDSLPIATGALYIRKRFYKTKKNGLSTILTNVRSAYESALKNAEWMDDKTKRSALDKLKYMTQLIDYPEELLDNQKLDDYYKTLNLDKDSFLKVKLSVELFNFEMDVMALNKPYNISNWKSTFWDVTDANALYFKESNVLHIPAAFSQMPRFHSDNPMFMNYAGIGFVAGHEISHGFDDEGIRFDKDGRWFWWQNKTQEEYENKLQCIVDQYNNYTFLNLYGEATKGENFADNAGMKVAYNAWKMGKFREPALPGFELFTPNKMFWISFAHNLCAYYSPYALRFDMLTDEHSVSMVRVDGVLSNMPEFAVDFNCPKGSPMNPNKKCQIW